MLQFELMRMEIGKKAGSVFELLFTYFTTNIACCRCYDENEQREYFPMFADHCVCSVQFSYDKLT
jgi:hypothetical protein